MKVKVGRMPGRIQEVELQDGATIADALRVAGLDASGNEMRLNGMVTDDFNRPVNDGGIVLLSPRIKGNNDGYTNTVKFQGQDYMLQTYKVSELIQVAETTVPPTMQVAEISEETGEVVRRLENTDYVIGGRSYTMVAKANIEVAQDTEEVNAEISVELKTTVVDPDRQWSSEATTTGRVAKDAPGITIYSNGLKVTIERI